MDTQALMRYRVRMMTALGLVAFLVAAPRSNAAFLIGFIIGALGEALRVWAAGHLQKGGTLVTDGPYAMVRHPLYLGSALLAVGACVAATTGAHPGRTLAVWALAGSSLPWLYGNKVRGEEAELARDSADFGPYRIAVPTIVPDIDRLGLAVRSTRFELDRLIENREHVTALAVLLLAIVLRFRQVYRW